MLVSAITNQKDNGAVSLPVNTFLSVSFMDSSYDEMSVKVEAEFEREKRGGEKRLTQSIPLSMFNTTANNTKVRHSSVSSYFIMYH